MRQLEQQRSVIRRPINPTDPEFNRLTAEIKTANSSLKDLSAAYRWPIDEYPERFLQLFDGIASIDQEMLATFRHKAERWVDDMRVLCETHDLKNPEAWLTELDEAWKSQQRFAKLTNVSGVGQAERFVFSVQKHHEQWFGKHLSRRMSRHLSQRRA